MKLLLAINPGSTSTKLAVFEQGESIFQATLRHSAAELQPFASVAEQFAFRKEAILSELRKAGISVRDVAVVVGRGGLVKPVESGVYEVNEAMKADMSSAKYGEHACNLGALIADNLARALPSAKAYIADPVVVDEMQDVARVAGAPMFARRSIFHALNQKAIARLHAAKVGKEYEALNLIVAHLGGGISVGAHRQGRVVDVNNALGGDGAFSPERTGTTPALQLLEACYSGRYTKAEMTKMLVGGGGLVAHLGTNDAQQATQRAAQGDRKAAMVVNALCYQVGKEIGAMAAVLHGRVDGILITGGIAHSSTVTSYVEQMVAFIAPVFVYPGEDEMWALATNVLQMQAGKLPLKKYV
ncbi:MAG: butyrate kinase [Prevotellaceae bacterium]|jgi:butyrate kinase|nr:butyrate kinase [Prevotellaceae bacterium]